MPSRTCTAMKYRPIGLPLRSRPRRCSSVAASSSAALRTGFAPAPSAAALLGAARRRLAGSLRRAATRSLPGAVFRPRAAAPASGFTAGAFALLRRRSARRPGREAGSWGWASCRRCAACAPAPSRRPRPRDVLRASARAARCRCGRRRPIVARHVFGLVRRATTCSRSASRPLPRRRWPPREPRRRLGPDDGLGDAPDDESGEVSALPSVERSESV